MTCSRISTWWRSSCLLYTSGNKVRERTAQGGGVYQNNIMAYDALGRLREVSDGYLRQNIDYDANGNRTRVRTQYTDASDTWRNRDYWYGYDAMNRQTTVEAVNANLEINAAQGLSLIHILIGELSGEGAAKLDGSQTQAEIDAIWKTYGTTYTLSLIHI